MSGPIKKGYNEQEKTRIIKRVVEGVQQGQTATEAARLCGVTMASVVRWMRERGVKLPDRRLFGGRTGVKYEGTRPALMQATDYLDKLYPMK